MYDIRNVVVSATAAQGQLNEIRRNGHRRFPSEVKVVSGLREAVNRKLIQAIKPPNAHLFDHTMQGCPVRLDLPSAFLLAHT